MPADAVVERRPRAETEVGSRHAGDAEAEQDQARDETGKPRPKVVTANPGTPQELARDPAR
jgi:hypothetical protein